MIEIGAKNVPRSILRDLGAFWREPKFRRLLRRKNRPKIGKLKPEGRLHPILGGGTSEKVDLAEALEPANS